MGSTVILGAGIAGLGVACASGFQYPIYEKNAYVGGLCHSFQIEGFTFDTAVHLSFTKDSMVKELFLKAPHYTYRPYPVNWYQNHWIKHPIQNNLHSLPPEERVKAIKSFIERPDKAKFTNFKAWLTYQFGSYISEHFSEIYNKKYWCEDLERLGTEWVGNRLYQPSLEDILLGAFTEDTPNTYYASEMRYPKAGGFEAFLSQLEQRATISLNKEVVRVNGKKRELTFSDGEHITYEKVFSSIPLPDLLRMTEDVPPEILSALDELNHTGVILISVGFNKPDITENIWFYIYDTDILTSRVYSPSNKSKANVPEGCSSLQFEIYYNARKGCPWTEQECTDNVRYALKKMHLAKEEDILFTDYRIQPYGNVIMYPENRRNVETIHQFLQKFGIVPIGRFGEWDYLWSDQAFLSGYEKVRENG